MASELYFVISDNSLNRYKFRVLTEGIRTENYMRNPVVLAYHDDRLVSVGKCVQLTKEAEGNLKAKVEFDEGDPFAVLIFNKYKNGYMSATSLGLLPLVESVDEKDLLPGQSYPTIVESDMLEMSLVNVPGNSNAVKLYDAEMKEVRLSMLDAKPNFKPMSKEEKTVEQLLAENQSLKKTLAADLVTLHMKRGAIDAGEADFFTRSAENDYDATRKVLELRPDKKDPADQREAMADQLVKLHFERGAIAESEQDFYKKAASADYEGTKKVLELRKGKDAVDSFLGAGTAKEGATAPAGVEDRAKWTYLDFYKKDPEALAALKLSAPEKHKTLLEAHKTALRKSGKVQIDQGEED